VKRSCLRKSVATKFDLMPQERVEKMYEKPYDDLDLGQNLNPVRSEY
jgi:hypothetical protein